MSGGQALLRSGRLAPEPLQPTGETGLYLHRHEHEWVHIGANQAPIGSWHPVFRCEVCSDVIEDNRQFVGADPEAGIRAWDDLDRRDRSSRGTADTTRDQP